MLKVKKCAVILASFLILFTGSVSAGAHDKAVRREGMISGMMDFIRNSTDVFTQEESTHAQSAKGGTDDIFIDVYFHREDEIRTVELDEYIMGVVYGEVPESYGIEALKAQAVAARSYAVYRIENNILHANGADVCTDYTHCQAWTRAEDGAYPESIAQAVSETHNIIGTYDGKCINALYFSNSGGYTESIENVWGGAPSPYLVSVESPGESENYDYISVKYFTAEDFTRIIAAYTGSEECDPDDALSNITEIKRSESGRIISANVAGKALSGLKIREMLGTQSSNIFFKALQDGSVVTVSMGYGHGAGMSQCGAQAMAKKGAAYDEILKHYYTGIELTEIDAVNKA